jgi:hypothetical protein
MTTAIKTRNWKVFEKGNYAISKASYTVSNVEQSKIDILEKKYLDREVRPMVTIHVDSLDLTQAKIRIADYSNKFDTRLIKEALSYFKKESKVLCFFIPQGHSQPMIIADNTVIAIVMPLKIDIDDISHVVHDQLIYFKEKTGLNLLDHWHYNVGLVPMHIDQYLQKKFNPKGNELSTYQILDSIDPKLTDTLRIMSKF